VAWNSKDGVFSKEHVGGMHPCTEAEYAKFYEPAKASKGAF
jgi:hypothetical protein